MWYDMDKLKKLMYNFLWASFDFCLRMKTLKVFNVGANSFHLQTAPVFCYCIIIVGFSYYNK